MLTTLNMQSNVPLAPHTTLGVGGSAKLFVEVGSVEELASAIGYAKEHGEPFVVFGCGTNLLVSDAGYDGLVIKMSIEGIQVIDQNEETVVVKVGAGVNFDSFVEYTVEKGWWGLENLSSIPGTVGATPVQNVGAYGAEIAQVLVSVEVYDTDSDNIVTLSNTECHFGYRTSIFKAKPLRYIITSVTFSLLLKASPQCTYADLAKRFEGEASPSLQAIREAVQEIRSQKFPDWTVIGTAGSFFKNPIVPKSAVTALLEKYPELPYYKEAGEMVKLPLGHILDKICGLKGYKKGKVGLYERQALVLVVEKGASAGEVIDFAEEIVQKVFTATGITIEREVTLL
jgi:UDP-N-acetylmuramate dehydrogenase